MKTDKPKKPRGKQHDLRSATLDELAKAHRERAEYWKTAAATDDDFVIFYRMHKEQAEIFEAVAEKTRKKR